MGEVIAPSQDLCSFYHVSSSDNSSFNRVYSFITQQERQVFGDQSKAIIATSKGGYKNNATTYDMGCGHGRGSYGKEYTSKFAVIVERQGIQGYKRLIGRLMYLTNTRPDITFHVQQLSQFLAKPTIAHYTTTIRILEYIKGVPSLGLFFSSNTYAHLKAFYDSDWGHMQ